MHTDELEWKKKFIGPKDFYLKVGSIALPLAVSSVLQNTMSAVDTLMVSWIDQVSAVGTAAQVDVLCGSIAIGIISGVGMFVSQFYGAGDERNLKRCMGLSLLVTVLNGLFWFLVSSFFGRQILMFYMKDQAIVDSGYAYLSIFKYSFMISAFNYCFNSMYRSTGQAKFALNISIISTVLNIIFNSLFIFGLGPFPNMGVRGAALGSVLSSLSILIIYATHAWKTRQPFVGSLREMMPMDRDFIEPILNRTWPLIINEITFGIGQTLFVKIFGLLGKQQMDAYYVANQVYNFCSFIIYGYGGAIQILLGMQLGMGHVEEARKECYYHIGLATVLAFVLVILIGGLAGPMVSIFRITDPVTNLIAVRIVHVFAIKAALRLFNYMIFSILRSGGDSKIIQLLDSGMVWLVGLPAAYLTAVVFHAQDMAIVLLFAQLEQLFRMILGMRRILQFHWARDLTKLVRN